MRGSIIIILTPEQMAAAQSRPGDFVFLDGETAWRMMQDDARGLAESRCAFYCLALVGLAVAQGVLAVAVALDTYAGPPDPWPHRRTYEEHEVRSLARKVLALAKLGQSTAVLDP